jgi:hypothetical protein
MFKEERTTHIAACLLQKAGGAMNHLMLMRLMYLADKIALVLARKTMTGDTAIYLGDMPALAATYDLMTNGKGSKFWGKWISPISNDELALITQIEPSQIDMLSRFDFRVLDEVWAERDAPHEFPELESINGCNRQIPVASILLAAGEDSASIKRTLKRMEEENALEMVLASL